MLGDVVDDGDDLEPDILCAKPWEMTVRSRISPVGSGSRSSVLHAFAGMLDAVLDAFKRSEPSVRVGKARQRPARPGPQALPQPRRGRRQAGESAKCARPPYRTNAQTW